MKEEMERMPIIIAPKYTRATFMTAMAADHLYEWMRQKGFSPIKISGFRTRKPVIRKELKLAEYQPKPLLICYFGHGLADAWIGMEDMRARFLKRTLIKIGINDSWLDKDAIIYTISCFTLKELGPQLIKGGHVRTYFGSSEKMLVNPIDNNIEPKTVPDFVDIFTIGQKYIASGRSCGEALSAYYQRCDEIIQNYEKSGLLDKSKQLRNAYAGIKMNRDFFGAVGDLGSRWINEEQLAEILKNSAPDSTSVSP